MTYYVISRQTTQKGTATNIVAVSSDKAEDALRKAKIKLYDIVKVFNSETTMVSYFVGVSDLFTSNFVITEGWVKETEPETNI